MREYRWLILVSRSASSVEEATSAFDAFRLSRVTSHLEISTRADSPRSQMPPSSVIVAPWVSAVQIKDVRCVIVEYHACNSARLV